MRKYFEVHNNLFYRELFEKDLAKKLSKDIAIEATSAILLRYTLTYMPHLISPTAISRITPAFVLASAFGQGAKTIIKHFSINFFGKKYQFFGDVIGSGVKNIFKFCTGNITKVNFISNLVTGLFNGGATIFISPYNSVVKIPEAIISYLIKKQAGGQDYLVPMIINNAVYGAINDSCKFAYSHVEKNLSKFLPYFPVLNKGLSREFESYKPDSSDKLKQR